MNNMKDGNTLGVLSEKEIFKGLTKSAFEFLDRSIDEFSKSAKFSTIHFAIAIELFLKAKLMSEHWSLLVDRPDQADRAAFLRGNAKTVSPEHAIERLHKIAQVSIPRETKEAFAVIARHRNKMVHFVHTDNNVPINLLGQTQIAREQCAGWLGIKTLIGQWSEFKGFANEINRISRKMEGHRVFLEEVFETKKDELKKHIEQGLDTRDCPSCGFLSVKIEAGDGAISPAQCVVCRYHGTEITVRCDNDNCRAVVKFSSYHGHPVKCSVCEGVLTEQSITDQLDTGMPYNKDTMMDYTYINCPSCMGYHSVVEHQSSFICVKCFDSEDEMEVCQYCGEGQLGGVGEDSYLTGCEFCDGASAKYADD